MLSPFSPKTFQSNELFEGKNTKLMKDKKLEANLSMVASRVMAGLNMNGLKFLLPLWLGALTGVTVRCVFAAVAFWITSWFVKEAPATKRQRIGLFCLGAFGLYGFMFCYLLGISKTTPVSSAIFNSMQPIWVFLISVFFLHEKATLMKIIGIALGFGGALLCILTQGSDDLAHDAFTGNMFCMVSSLVFAVYLIVSKKLLEEVGVVTMMKYIFGGAAVTGLIVSSIIGWNAPLLTDALHGEWHWVPWAVLALSLIHICCPINGFSVTRYNAFWNKVYRVPPHRLLPSLSCEEISRSFRASLASGDQIICLAMLPPPY